MRVFVTGATGFIGSAVVRELIEAGHQVTGLARSDAAARSLQAAGARVHRGTIEDLDSLRRGAAAAEGAIHTAFFHEFTHAALRTRLRAIFGGAPSGIVARFMGAALETDRRAIDTIGRALTGPDRSLVIATGTMSLRPGRTATEDDAPDPAAAGGPRGASEAVTLGLKSLGVRASIVRLPPLVHGDDDRRGLAPRLIEIARKRGASATIGDGGNRWPAVHRLDAACLFRLVLESGSGRPYHAIGDEGVPFREIAGVIARRLNVPLTSKTPAEASSYFSWLGAFVGVDNPASGTLTQELMGWRPTHAGLLADLDAERYFKNERRVKPGPDTARAPDAR